MRLARFRNLSDYLHNCVVDICGAKDLEVYRHFEGFWYDEFGEGVADDPLIAGLEETLARNSHWREPRHTIGWFPIPEIEVVVLVHFASPPRSSTQKAAMKDIRQCLENAENAFKATHDRLTGLFDAEAFGRKLRQECSTALDHQSDAAGIRGAKEPAMSLSVLAMDIDHFKQVNDTFGHIYGDIVLRALAMRLEILGTSIERGGQEPTRLLLSRPSGEEFLVGVAGTAGPDACRKIAEQIREAIADRPLPSEDEWRICEREGITQGVVLPDIRSRKITVSIGIASLGEGERTERFIDQLRSDADIALFRAKRTGRNRVIHFNDIRALHGKVLEYHAATGVVVVDIGRRVGVASGQEFHVLHPDFGGETPFVFEDGRTKRQLGVYPRRKSWRIVAFDVQQEVSFCYLATDEHQDIQSIPIGAGLEAIPVGSITHLLVPGRGRILWRALTA